MSDLAKSSWRRLDAHEEIMKTLCEPKCLDAAKTFVDKCDGVDMMKDAVPLISALLPLCDECVQLAMEMEGNPPKTPSGDLCFEGRRRLSELTTPVSPWRRLDGHVGIMNNICESECEKAAETIIDVCEKTQVPELVGWVELLQNVLPMCNDKCLKAIMWMEPNGCDGGEDSKDVCDFTGDCEGLACAIKRNCEMDDPPMGMSKSEWEKGLGDFLDAEASCSLCPKEGPATTSSGTQTMLTGFAAALLFAAFALQ